MKQKEKERKQKIEKVETFAITYQATENIMKCVKTKISN